MLLTAYHRWLYISHEGDRDEIAAQIYSDCVNQRNPQAFDLLVLTGDTSFKPETFIKAADLILKQYESENKQNEDDSQI